MRFAIDKEGKRILPSKGGRGFCPLCQKTVIARCGNIRAHHWYHESLKDCEYTKYTHVHETPWHINWKNHFDVSWQEIILPAPNGDKHISDVRTPQGLTIEFQHSPITDEERISREQFYSSVGEMIWVVDGTKSKCDWARWYNNRLLRESLPVLPGGGMITENAKEMLPAEWLYCRVPVFFDFLGTEPPDEAIPEKKYLICVLCRTDQQAHFFIPIKKELFIALCHSGEVFAWIMSKLPRPKSVTTPPPLGTTSPTITMRSQAVRRSRQQPYRDGELDNMLDSLIGLKPSRPQYKKRKTRHSSSKKRRHR